MTARASSPSGTSPPVILIVDDEGMMRDLMRRMLERAGFSVVTAVNGLDGMVRFREHQVALVVTDMLMPEMDGAEFMRALLAARPTLPIIVVTGPANYFDLAATSARHGAKATIRKPLISEELVQTIRRLLAADVGSSQSAAARL
jgi:two-component system, OmpR family, response regulator